MLLHLVKYIGKCTRFWYLSHRRAAKARVSLHNSPEPSLMHTESMDVDEYSDQILDLCLCWMRQHMRLFKSFVHIG